MPREYSTQEIEHIRERTRVLKNKSAVALELDIPRTTVVNFTRDLDGSPLGGGYNPVHIGRGERPTVSPCGTLEDRGDRRPIDVTPRSEETEPALPATDWEEKGDVASVSFVSDKQIRTIDEAVQYGGVDTSVWLVKSWRCGAWTTNMKLRQGQGPDGRWRPEQGVTKQNWKVHLDLARILPKPFMEATDALFERMKGYTPTYQPIQYAKPTTPHLLEVDLFDCHFGKLAWARETGEDYDLKIAERIFKEAVEDILSRAVGYGIERIVLPVGNDFFNVDNLNNETTNGTPQDQDGRYSKMIEVGEMSLIWAVEKLREVAPVEVVYVPGNHDRVSSWHAVRTLWAWFNRCDDVTVEFEPKTRKYMLYGKTLVMYTHGNEEKAVSLPGIMATEAPLLWAASTYREVHRGHVHRARRTETTAVDTVDGVKIRDLQSLSGRDAWHARKGFANGKRAAEAFLYCKATGNVHSFDVSVRDN